MSIRLAVLISGTGTNLQAIIDAIDGGELDATVELVVSSRPEAPGLKRAEAAGIQTLSLSREIYDNPETADLVIVSQLKARDIDYVVMAGYMRKVGPAILLEYADRVINIHPALLPSFKGAHAIEEAHERGVKVTGVTVHIANAQYDAGPIIAQEALTVDQGWSLGELEEAIHRVEHRLYPATLQLLAEDRVVVEADRRVRILPPGETAQVLRNWPEPELI